MIPEPIWYPGPVVPYVWIEQRLSLSGEVEAGWLQCAASGPYQLRVNGQLAGRGLGRSLTQEAMWEHFALKGLRIGENALAVLAAGDGAPAWFAAQGEITYVQGGRIELATGTPWQVARAVEWEAGEVLESEICWAPGAGARERRDAGVVLGVPIPGTWSPWPAAEQEAWARQVVEFGETEAGGEWRFVPEIGPLRQGKCVHREGLLRPGRTWTRAQTRDPEWAILLVLDFGRLVTGFPRLRLRGGAGGRVELGFARAWGQVEGSARYVCGPGAQEWTGLRLRTCRYLVVRLSLFQEEVEIDWIGMLEWRVAVEAEGAVSALPLLGRIWEIGQDTLAACRQEVYYFPGTGEYDWLRAHALALNDYYLTGDIRTAAALVASSRPQREEPVQGLAYLLFLDAYLLYSGERGQVAGLLEGALECLGAGLVAEGWPPTALNALYAGALAAAGRLCRWTGEKAAAGRWEQEAGRVRRRMQKAWDPEQGLFADGPGIQGASQWSNGLVLYFGLAEPAQQEQAARRIGGARPVGDLLEAFFLEGGLWQAGQGDQALAYLEARWGGLVGRVGQTWGEKVSSPRVLPGPEYYLGAQVLGVRPGAPGYYLVEIRPPRLGLQGARGRVRTRQGQVEVAWAQEEGRFAVEVKIEAEGETRVWMPRLGRRFPTVSLNGETLWRNEKFHPNPFVREVIAQEEHVGLALPQGGEYRAVVE